ncbi:AfsR/SARP family transcriptional regulator [Saccharothrix xinjiangensis]|uniref:BTAD domain-containing putative transcriptional regulator n=1 Tax=Saccharothrix xinjiangensis TaxID=204798 RepID=A0ABV9Y850_9PSEU
MIRFNVLGPLEVWHGAERVAVPSGRGRVLLATLLLRANEQVTVDELVDRLWDGGASKPERAKATLQMVVRRLRQALGEANVVRTVVGGYFADVPPGALDLHRFRELVARDRLAEALALWRGAPLADVASDVLHRDDVAPLLEERLAVLERRVAADLGAGRSAELVPELRSLTARHPLRERFWGALVLALHRSGRTAEALAAYQEVRGLLAEELGIDPSEELRSLHQVVLGASPPRAARPVAPPRQVAAAAQQLPADVRSFTGRQAELAALDRLVADTRAATVVAITGMGGLGKTALAVHWAHSRAADFPDGRLFANLRGFDHDTPPLAPEQALTHLLGALGTSPERIPAALDQQVALYRSLLADRRALVVLDNAADVAQVRPLLPSGPGNFVLVTGRNDLRGLLALNDAVLVRLDVLAPVEGLDLLRRILGPERVDAETGASAELVEVCGGLPLALRVAAATMAAEGCAAADYVAALKSGDRLSGLEIPGDPASAVRVTFHLSYRALTPSARQLFRLLGVVPCRDFTAETAAALTGAGLDGARRALAELLRAHLLEQPQPGRFVMHDLLRLHAEACATTEESEEDRRLAAARLLDFYLHNVDRADRVSRRSRTQLPLTPVADTVPLLSFEDRRRAMGWVGSEMPNLRVLIPFAAERGWHEHAWQIPAAMWSYLHTHYVWAEWRALTEIALASARHLGNRFAEAIALHTLGSMTRRVRPEDSLVELSLALEIREEIRHEHGTAATCLELSGAYESLGRYAEAVAHGERVVELWTAQGNQEGLAVALNNLAGTLSLAGHHEQALAVGERAVDLYRRSSGMWSVKHAQETVAQILHRMGRWAEAAATYESIFATGVGDMSRLAALHTHTHYSDLLLDLGDLAAARVHLGHALDIAVATGYPDVDDIRAGLARLG